MRVAAFHKLNNVNLHNMAWEWVAQVAPAVATLGSAVFGLTRGEGRVRRHIRHDAETMEHLPKDSAAHNALLTHIEKQINALSKRETEGSRDWAGASIGAVLGILLGYSAIWLFTQEYWWRFTGILPAFVAAACLYGLIDSLTVKERQPRKDRRQRGTE